MQELRFEDYQQGRKGKQQGGTLGGLGQLGSGLNTSVGGGRCVRTYVLVCIHLYVCWIFRLHCGEWCHTCAIASVGMRCAVLVFIKV